MELLLGDCLDRLKELEDNSVDAIVCDPPYGLSFMGKKWDYDVPSVDIWRECLRVLKPGGYLLSFAGTRTQHRMAVNIEDAGFEIRDMIAWVYGSGFPKSRNIGLDIDKKNGITKNRGKAFVTAGQSGQKDKDTGGDLPSGSNTIGAYKAKNEWTGWGTALKPALEPITVARKPIEGTVAENCLKWGVGGINIDGCRVGTEDMLGRKNNVNPYGSGRTWSVSNTPPQDNTENPPTGRFPANLIHDGSEEVRGCFPNVKTGSITKDINGRESNSLGKFNQFTGRHTGDSGNASRFFYCAKASKRERNIGCEGLPLKSGGSNAKGYTKDVARGLDRNRPVANFHPTVKPIALMEYLVKLVSREGQVVLDPFMGSGTTGMACKELNRDFIGIEMMEEYMEIAKCRIEATKKDEQLNMI